MMAQGHRRAGWGYWSSLLAMTANCHRDPQKKREPYEPADFNVFEKKQRKHGGGIKGFVAAMKDVARMNKFR